MTLDALVTDAQLRWAVGGVRALAAAGVRTGAMAPSRGSAGLWSRRAVERIVGPDGYTEPAAYAAAVGRAALEHGPLVVYPAQDETLDALIAAGSSLSAAAILPYPGPEPLARLRDKRLLPDRAHEAGLTVPLTIMEATVAEIRRADPPLPHIIKPPRPDSGLSTPHVVATVAERDVVLDGLPEDEPLLVQEVAALPLVGLALVTDRDGVVVARFQQVARRQWPVPVGGSTLALSVAPDAELVARSARLLAGTGFWGLAQLQFLSTVRGPALIDVNTRFYGSLPLATASGVNLPHAWHAVTTGTAPPADAGYRVGVHYRWLAAEISAARNGYPRRLLWRSPRPKVGAVWDRGDPLPGLVAAAETAGPMVARVVRGVAARAGLSRS